MTTWTNMSSDPSSDERVLRDAQKTIEKVVEAARLALDDELAVQQMEYDQVYGLNSMQFAMYQTLVMTFFQDHQMLASLNLKRSQRDLSPGVNESKRAQLMEVIAQRVSTGAQGTGNPGRMPVQQGQQGAWQNGGSQSPPGPAWGVPGGAPVQTNNANWLDQPAPQTTTDTSAGDWLSKPGTPERPPSSAWPTTGDGGGNGPNWTVKPGGGQLPSAPAPSESNGGWSSSPNGWPSEKSKTGEGAWPQPTSASPVQAQATAAPTPTTESPWPVPSQASSWPEQPGAVNKQLPPAAWPASNSGNPPTPPEVPAPAEQQGVVRPAWSTPIGDSGQSGTWTLDSKPAAPPAAAWTNSNGQESPTSNWNAPQPAASVQTQTSTSGNSPAPAWAEQPVPQGSWNAPTNPGELPQPAWQNNSGQNSVSSGGQPWQAPSPSAPTQQWQSGANPAPAAPQPAAQPWQQQNPSVITTSASSGQPPQPAWAAPTGGPPQPAWQSQPSAPPQQPWQAGAPQAPPPQQPQQSPQSWTPPGLPAQGQSAQPWTPPGAPAMTHGGNSMPGANGTSQAGANGVPQPGSNGTPPPAAWQTGTGMTPPVMPQPQPQLAYQAQQTQYPTGQDYPNPAQYQAQYPSQDQAQQQMYQQQPSGNTEDMSISFSQQAPQGQNGATLGGVLRQMRSFDNTRKREDEQPPDSYNPNNAW